MENETCKELASEGERLCKNGDFQNGISFFEAALKLGTTDSKLLSSIYAQLGNAYFILANQEKTIHHSKTDSNRFTNTSNQVSDKQPSTPTAKSVISNYDFALFNFTNNLYTDNSETNAVRNTVSRRRPHTIHLDSRDANTLVSESELLREILFVFQGLNGRILIQDPNNDGRYTIDTQYFISPPVRKLVLRLTNIGWLFNKINKYCNFISNNVSLGHICQSFAAALQEEIRSYYGLVTMIEQMAQFKASDNGDKPGVSLLNLHFLTFESFYCLKMFTLLVEKCKNKRGGALVYVVHQFVQHGDPLVKECMTRILRQVVMPIQQMLGQWLFHGELEDSFKEFFITSSRSGLVSPGDALWHEKYNINKNMFPGFITMQQAKKILATGKAVNLLKQIGENAASLSGYDELKKLFESTKVEQLFNDHSSTCEKGEFQKLLQSAYKETSEKALKLLFDDYLFMNHLKGLRSFLLLGQGDFIRHLMDILEPELEKPAHHLKQHSLASLLNRAIRCTNAQFFDEDVIDRVDVRIPDKSVEETGWDVFALTYQTRGPISTILTAHCMNHYSGLFKHLWRSKRMEYVLTSLWKRQVTHVRNAQIIPKLKPVFHFSQILLSEMMHFIQQMQYYIEFEVMECSWAELLRKIANAKDIDGLVDAHEFFLNSVISRLMLDAESQELAEQLRAIYDVIIEFQSLKESFWKVVSDEVNERKKFNHLEATKAQAKTESERRNHFESDVIPNFRVRIQLLSTTYQDMVQKFLLLLADHPDADLRFLSFRLDFNEHYKKRNKSLETSFTYSKHRYSTDTSITSKSIL
ncbi:gamma-tubulin complex component 3-like protein [Dinothrombium tinctorium]|uniref:Gamma-tubulin complex component 3-like protein n=1 Tax=Dinothrombium tinctorium TaxID=1965070 RepID=A0A3S3QUT3_9ACAR|nr:gamma-tubulin complex component 3-like protein [Dinothrombium tinctorium]RWS14294.1 gamma-tubulin complex component 3-like protein [Dinothrombium tinctorium]